MVASYLKKEGASNQIAAYHGVSDAVISKSTQAYRTAGIKALKDMEERPLRKKRADTSKDAELVQKLYEELSKLKSLGGYTNTLKRGEIVASYLKKEGTARNVGTSHNVACCTVSKLTQAYRAGGIEALKKMKNYTSKRKRTENNTALFQDALAFSTPQNSDQSP